MGSIDRYRPADDITGTVHADTFHDGPDPDEDRNDGLDGDEPVIEVELEDDEDWVDEDIDDETPARPGGG